MKFSDLYKKLYMFYKEIYMIICASLIDMEYEKDFSIFNFISLFTISVISFNVVFEFVVNGILKAI